MKKNKIISLILAFSIASSQVVPSFAVNNYKTKINMNDKIWSFTKKYVVPFLIGVTTTGALIKIFVETDNIEKKESKDIKSYDIGDSHCLKDALIQLYRIDGFKNKILNTKSDKLKNKKCIKALKSIFENINNHEKTHKKLLKDINNALGYEICEKTSDEYILDILKKCSEELNQDITKNIKTIDIIECKDLESSENFSISDNSIKLDNNHRLLILNRHNTDSLDNIFIFNGADENDINTKIGYQIFNNKLNNKNEYLLNKFYPTNIEGRLNVTTDLIASKDDNNIIKISAKSSFTDISKAYIPTETLDNENYSLTGVIVLSNNNNRYCTYQKSSDGTWKKIYNNKTEEKEFESIKNDIETKGVVYMYTKIEK